MTSKPSPSIPLYNDLRSESEIKDGIFGKVKSSERSSPFNGWCRKCPCCGQGKIFNGYLTLKAECEICKAPVGQIRADDFPPYLTIFAVGHILVPLLLVVETKYHPDVTFQMFFWPTLGLLLGGVLLPFFKGLAVGLMWKMGLTGSER